MSNRWLKPSTVAIVLSVALHVLFIGSRMPGEGGDAGVPEMTAIELVPIPIPAPAPPEPEPEPVLEPEPEPTSEPHPEPRQRPRLAARLTPQVVAPPIREVVPEPAPEPPPEPVVEPDPVVLPVIPPPREYLRKQVVRQMPRPLTDEERVKGRVVGMLQDYLPPLPNDKAPMPALRPDGEGNLVHEDGALLATIAPDGSVTFGRRRGGSIDGLHGKSPDPGEQDILNQQARLPYIPLAVRRASEADCAAGQCQDKAGLGLTFRPNSDLNDAILRARGDDPLAARKRRFLRLTRDLRDDMAEKAHRQKLGRSKLRASRHLEKLWNDESLSFAQKRSRLFALWDECDEPTDEEDDRPEAKAGIRARGLILKFIRTKMPRGSPGAFSEEEIGRLNEGRDSKRAFSPY